MHLGLNALLCLFMFVPPATLWFMRNVAAIVLFFSRFTILRFPRTILTIAGLHCWALTCFLPDIRLTDVPRAATVLPSVDHSALGGLLVSM